jgi:hypothetical protein
MMEGGYKTMGGPTQPADDSAGRTIGATDQNQTKDKRGLKRSGNVYIETQSDGSQIFFPAKHMDNGLRLPFSTKEEAEAANDMSEDEAKRFASAGSEQGQGLDQSVGMGRGGSGISLPGT